MNRRKHSHISARKPRPRKPTKPARNTACRSTPTARGRVVLSTAAHPLAFVRSLQASRWRLLQGCALGLTAFSMSGCSLVPSPFPAAAEATAPQPVLRIQGQQLTGAHAYAMGKASLAAGDLQRALLHFEQALKLQPMSADAENGRLVTLARLGRVDEAISLGQRAIALGTSSAELHGNLGMLLDERGDSRRAAIHLARAAQLDPANPAWQHWTMAEAVSAPAVSAQASAGPSRLAQRSESVRSTPAEPIVAPVASAEGLRWIQQAPHVLTLTGPAAPAATATATSPATVPTGGAASATPPSVIVLAPSTAVANGDARQVSASLAVPPVKSALAATPAAMLQASTNVLSRIEISNGHGRKGLAREIASGLQSVMSGPARITNHANFRVQLTEVQYRTAEERPAAQMLARSLGVSEDRVVLNSRLRDSAPVRLLLGRDAPDTQEAITDTLARALRTLQG